MDKKGSRRVLGRGTSLFIALVLGASSFLVNVNVTTLKAQQTQAGRPTTPPALAKPNEVKYDAASTALAVSAETFLSAYKNENISRIVLNWDIDISGVQSQIRSYRLKRSIQIDGDGYRLKSTDVGEINESSLFYLDTLPKGSTATIHLKNLKVWTRGTDYVDNGAWLGPRGEGWQLILEDVDFQRNPSAVANQTDRARRVARLGRGHIFLRGNVSMITSGENFYAGQITVDPNAKVYGEIDKIDNSNWWFSENNAKITSVDSTLNIGENAYVELLGVGGRTYPAIYEHFRAINVHPGATLKASKPGNAYAFHPTSGMTDKDINVFEGARIEGTSTGNGSNPIMEEKGSGYMVAHFYAAPKSIVKFVGKSNNTSNALIHFRNNGSSFELNQPAEYDIRNNLGNSCQEYDEATRTCIKVGGGSTKAKAVTIASGSRFILTSSDIEVWDTSKAAKDLNSTPDYGWYKATVIADSKGAAIEGTEDPNATDTSPNLKQTWNTNNYARITGVNGRPSLSFDELTNADKSYTVKATVLGQPAWWESQVTVHVTNDKGDDVQDGGNGPGGNFKYTLPNGAFFETGTTYTATGYRGSQAWPAENEAKVTVRDATPPKPVKINIPLYHTTEEISGTDGEPGATVSATLNNVSLNLATDIVVQPDGSWAFSLPDTIDLQPNDIIQVFLTDANGNTTPAETTPFRDATFEGATKVTVQQDTVPPILTIQRPIVYEKDKPVNEAQFFKDINPSMNKRIEKIESDFATVVQFDSAGAYLVNVKAYDRAGNWDEKQTVVLITDGTHTNIDEKNEAMISAYDFAIQLSDVPNADFVKMARSKAWHTASANMLRVILRDDKPEETGIYPITFAALNEDGETVGEITVQVYVHQMINSERTESVDAQDFAIALSEINEENFIKYAKAKGYDITNLPATELPALKVTSELPTTLGEHPVTFTTASGQTSLTVTVYVYNMVNHEAQQAINAHDFKIPLALVAETTFIDYAEAQGYDLASLPASELVVQMVTALPTRDGKHPVTFRIRGTDTAITVIADIVATNIELGANDIAMSLADANKTNAADLLARMNASVGTTNADATASIGIAESEVEKLTTLQTPSIDPPIELTVQGEDTAGDYTEKIVKVYVYNAVNSKAKEAINAHDFDIALSLVSQANFIELAEAKAYDITDLPGHELGGVRVKSVLPTKAGKHPVTFTFGDGETERTVIATVSDDVAPSLSADARIVYDKDITKTADAFLADVHAKLNESGTITSDFEAVVNLGKVGAYVVTLQGQDTAGNKAGSVQTIVLIKDNDTIIDEDSDTMLTAHDFSVNLSAVPAADFIALAGAQAWRISSTEPLLVQLTSKKPSTGGVHPVIFSVGKLNKVVSANVHDNVAPVLTADARIVYDKDITKTADAFLADVHAHLNELGTITSDFAAVVNLNQVGAYVVTLQGQDAAGNKAGNVQTTVLIKDKDTIIDEATDTMLVAHDFSVDLSGVPAADFVALAGAQAWRISSTEPLIVQLASKKPTTGGVHPVIFSAGKLSKVVSAKVNDNVDPVLSADTRIVYDIGSKKTAKAFLKDVHAQLNELGTITSDFEDVVNLNKVGAYVVTLQGQDTAGNKAASMQITVLIKDKDTIIDEDSDTMLVAHNFSVNLSDVPTADFVVLAGAQAWRISSTEQILVQLASEKPSTGGAHPVTFSAGALNKTVSATVSDNVDPVLSADARIVYDIGSAKTADAFLKDAHAALNEPGTITSDFATVVNLNQVGAYVVTLEGIDLAGNKANTVQTTVLVKDNDTIIDEDSDTMLTAHDFSVNLSNVPAADFVTLAGAQAWRISSTESLEVQLTSEKPSTGGVHPVTFSAGALNKTVSVTVSDNVAPVLTADARIIYDKGTAKTDDAFLEDVHARLNEPGTITSNFAAVVNLNQVGAYVVTLQGTDLTGNKANTVQTTVLIKDNDTIIDEDSDTMLTAHDFSVDLSDVPVADFVTLAGAQAWRISNTEPLEVQLASEKPSTGGVHPVRFSAGALNKTVSANVSDNVAPTLSADARIIYDKGTSKTADAFLKDVHAKLDEPGTITSDFATVVNLNQVGAYIVTLQGQDAAGNKAGNVQTTVLIKDNDTIIDEDSDIMLTAHDFSVNLSDVTDADFVALAGAQAWRISSTESLEVQLTSEKPSTGGVHPVTFSAGKLSKAVSAVVRDNVVPILTADARIVYDKGTSKTADAFLKDVHAKLNEPGTITSDFEAIVDLNRVGAYVVTLQGADIAGNKAVNVQTTVLIKDNDTIIDEDSDIMLTAHDFNVDLSDVTDADFVALARAEAWRMSTTEPLPVQLTSEKPSTGGVHPTTFSAGKLNKTVSATVHDNVNPILNADARIIYDKGVTKTVDAFLADVHAQLNEPGIITSNFAAVVNLNQVGAYIVRIEGIDLIGNKANVVQTTVLIKDKDTVIDEDSDTMLMAHDFSVNLSDVPTADFVVLAGAQAWRISSTEQILVQLASEKPSTGGAHPITFSAGTLNKTVSANVSDNVAPALSADARIMYDKGTSKTADAFLKDIHAQLNESGTITSDFATVVNLNQVGAYVVTLQGADAAGNKANAVQTTVLIKDKDTIIDEDSDTMLMAHDFSVNLSDVPAADFVTLAGAQAWRISSTELLEVQLASEKPSTGGVHPATFSAGTLNKTVSANVSDNVAPVLSADARIVYDKGTSKTADAFLKDVHAQLDELGTIRSDFAAVVDLNRVGAYVVTLQGTDVAGNKAGNVQTTVLIKDNDTVIDEDSDTMLMAHDFSVNLSDVPVADFVTLAGAQAWCISSTEPLEVQLTSEKPSTGGVHPVRFSAGKLSKAVSAVVRDNVVPILTADARIAYDIGSVKTADAFLKDVHAKLNEPGTIRSDFAAVVNLNQVGAYVVTTYGVDVAGNKAPNVQTIVFIKDKDTVIDEDSDTMLTAHDFSVDLSNVPAADFVALAGAQAWRISSTEPLEVQLTSEKPGTGGVHPVTFSAGKLSKTVAANVRDNVAPVLTADARIIYDKGTAKTADAFLEDVHAHLNEPGTIASNFAAVVNLNQVGAYVVTLQGADVAGNKANTVQTTVLIKDNDTIIDEDSDTMLMAHDFSVDLSDVPAADFVILAGAQAWRISSTEPLEVQLTSEKPGTGGVHPVTFSAGTLNKTVSANVNDNVAPTLNADARTVYDMGSAKATDAFLKDVHAKLNEPGTITSDFEAVVNLGKVGVYVVTLQGMDAAGNKANTVQTIVLIRDNDTIIDEDSDTMLTAHDFGVDLSHVATADFVALAGAQAWRISNAEPLVVELVSERPTTDGVHPVTFGAGKIIKTVAVTVLDDTIVFEADDVQFSVTEFNTLKKQNQLEAETLQRAKARAYVKGTGQEVTPLSADITELLAAEVAGGEKFDVVISYEDATSFAARSLQTGTKNAHIKVIKVSIQPEQKLPLPITGEDVTMLLIGLMTFISSIILLFFLFFHRKRRKEQEQR